MVDARVGRGGAGQRLLENGTVNAQKSVRSLSPAWPTASAAGRIGGSTKSIQCLMLVLRNEKDKIQFVPIRKDFKDRIQATQNY